MGAVVGLETVTCRRVLITWDGERSYSDFRLVHRRCS